MKRLPKLIMLSISSRFSGNITRTNVTRTASRAMTDPAMTSSTPLPSTMRGDPICKLVPPGTCQFTEEFQSVKLLERFPVSETSSVVRFALPDTTQPLKLSTCACILANDKIDGEEVTRPYTPISTNADIGYFDLLVKNYGPTAKMSRRLHEAQPGQDSISFKHIDFNVKLQAPFDYEHVFMIVGGTGVTPMIQALHAILGDSSNARPKKVTMLYGSRVSTDILGKDLLDAWSKQHPEKFQYIDVLSHEPEDSGWTGARGYIDQKMIEAYFDKPDQEDFLVFVCGPPPMYNALCGPREEKEVKGLLGKMGYKPEQVYKF